MAFDFTKLIKEEQKKQEETSSRSGGVGFKTVYPFNNGRLELKLIGNEPSGLLYREVMFHQYYSEGKKNKVPCLHQMYGLDCPICDAVNNVQDKLGDDKVYGTYGAKKQGFMFAKLLNYSPENYFGETKNPPKPGEIVIFMFPKSVINELRNMIIEFQDELDTIFTNNSTRNVTLKVTTGANGFPEYNFYVKNNESVLCVDANGNPDQAAFNEYMSKMPDIRTIKYPDKPDENMMKIHRAIVEEINNKYFGITTSVPPMNDPQPMVSNTGNAPATPPVQNVNVSNTPETINTSSTNNVNVTSQPDVNNVQENVTSEDPRGVRPPCFGNNEYNEKCAQCPWDAECV